MLRNYGPTDCTQPNHFERGIRLVGEVMLAGMTMSVSNNRASASSGWIIRWVILQLGFPNPI